MADPTVDPVEAYHNSPAYASWRQEYIAWQEAHRPPPKQDLIRKPRKNDRRPLTRSETEAYITRLYDQQREKQARELQQKHEYLERLSKNGITERCQTYKERVLANMAKRHAAARERLKRYVEELRCNLRDRETENQLKLIAQANRRGDAEERRRLLAETKLPRGAWKLPLNEGRPAPGLYND